jgi:outer membrane protein OmpA-like peptidoglycan-associated protein
MLAAAVFVSMLAACVQTPPPTVVASNPPPVPPGPNATWFHVGFATGSYAIDPGGLTIIGDVTGFLRDNPQSVATIIGKTDSVGGADYNMHLSHQRADAVRDALVYRGSIAADRVETRWTGETRQRVQTANNVSSDANRVVDIAVH